MALSQLTRRLLGIALTNNSAAKELADAVDLALGPNITGNNTWTGNNIIGDDPNDLIGFHGNAVAQRAGAAQAAVPATASTNVTPYGFSQAQADAIVTLLNEIRAALMAKGLIKGSA